MGDMKAINEAVVSSTVLSDEDYLIVPVWTARFLLGGFALISAWLIGAIFIFSLVSVSFKVVTPNSPIDDLNAAAKLTTAMCESISMMGSLLNDQAESTSESSAIMKEILLGYTDSVALTDVMTELVSETMEGLPANIQSLQQGSEKQIEMNTVLDHMLATGSDTNTYIQSVEKSYKSVALNLCATCYCRVETLTKITCPDAPQGCNTCSNDNGIQ